MNRRNQFLGYEESYKRFAEDERIHERKVKRRTQNKKEDYKLGVKAERYHMKGVLI